MVPEAEPLAVGLFLPSSVHSLSETDLSLEVTPVPGSNPAVCQASRGLFYLPPTDKSMLTPLLLNNCYEPEPAGLCLFACQALLPLIDPCVTVSPAYYLQAGTGGLHPDNCEDAWEESVVDLSLLVTDLEFRKGQMAEGGQLNC